MSVTIPRRSPSLSSASSAHCADAPERHSLGGPRVGQRRFEGGVHRVAFRRAGQIDNGSAIARSPSAGPTRVKQSHAEIATCIARGSALPTSSEAIAAAAGNVQRIAAGGDDPRIPVKCRIRRATAHRLMQSRNQIVEPVAFVIKARAARRRSGQQFRLQHPLARVIAFGHIGHHFRYSALAARRRSLARQWPCGSHPAK